MPNESVALVGDLRISTAAATVTAAKAITPGMKPSTMTVDADALVSGLFALAGAGPKAIVAGKRKTTYNQYGSPLFVYMDKMMGRPSVSPCRLTCWVRTT